MEYFDLPKIDVQKVVPYSIIDTHPICPLPTHQCPLYFSSQVLSDRDYRNYYTINVSVFLMRIVRNSCKNLSNSSKNCIKFCWKLHEIILKLGEGDVVLFHTQPLRISVFFLNFECKYVVRYFWAKAYF